MIRHRVASSFACILVTLACGSVFAQEQQPCEANYTTDGKSAETFVLTSLTPQAVVQRLPRLLAQAEITMQWAEPDKGIIKAKELDVSAVIGGESTRVTFRSSLTPPMDKNTLCRYASLVGSPPVAKNPPATQDPALIARMKDDLLKKHQIVLTTGARSLDNAVFRSLNDFLDFSITDVKQSPGRVEYEVSILVPRAACSIAAEDLAYLSQGLNGKNTELPTKPVRIKALLVYLGDGAASNLGDAAIVTIESTK